MTFALPMLLGGALFLAVHLFAGTLGVAGLGLILFALELFHDLRRYHKKEEPSVLTPLLQTLTDQLVEEEIHRVLCMNAKHRSRFTGECRSAPNIARGLRARLEVGE